ncbi:SDR family NAD(P)-dependent oxidoreductase [Leeia sp. TBRC 13508]|uniref:SDR family NAD(P)-dependent oxidoreductase n=1 Tax=Leeia speluncae TaxID=2884804 RepID=A0ABS8D1W5_9NEIS|nr:SDR family NAD(P)-dependent oxidoreductase [Leeia speluncae]MCB6182172.1 SDR family NAD(P)-dependent oxidoreductase [Leeia speluncae]
MIRCLLTGDSKGLGYALATVMVSQHIEVIGCARHAPPVSDWVHWPIDLSDPAQSAATFQQRLAELSWDDVTEVWLIHNAGTVQPIDCVNRLPIHETIAAFQINLVTPVVLTTVFLQVVEKLSIPIKVLNITSGAAQKAYPGWSVYGATKAGLDHFVRVAGVEDRPNVKVAAVAPGVLDTNMQSEIRATSKEAFPLLDRFIQLHESGELTDPNVVAKQLVEYLQTDTIQHGEITDVRNWV